MDGLQKQIIFKRNTSTNYKGKAFFKETRKQITKENKLIRKHIDRLQRKTIFKETH